MGCVVRGPNLPPRVVGALQGYLNVQLQHCSIKQEKHADTVRLLFWGLPKAQIPRFRVPELGTSTVVICPVVTEWSLFDAYLRQARAVVFETEATAKQVAVMDEFSDTKGHLTVKFWVDMPSEKIVTDGNKRMRVTPGAVNACSVDSVADVFDILDKTMSNKGIRLIDIYRFCNKLNTPVADLTSLIDRYVDRSIPLVHRNQFWFLLDPKGSRLFNFADFARKFKNAKRAMSTIRDGIKMEVAVEARFNAVYQDLISEEEHERELYKEIDAKTLVEHLKRCAPDAMEFDECCLLTTLFLELPKRTSWSVEEIRCALKLKPVNVEQKEAPKEVDAVCEGSAESEEDEETDTESTKKSEKSNADTAETTTSAGSRRATRGGGPAKRSAEAAEGAAGAGPSQRPSRGPRTRSAVQKEKTKKQKGQGSKQAGPPPDQAQSVTAETEALREALLDSLIAKCQALMLRMTTCAQSFAMLSQPSGVLPQVAANGETLAVLPSGRGLPDDPDALVRDVMSSALLLQRPVPLTLPPPVSGPRTVAATQLQDCLFDGSVATPKKQQVESSDWMHCTFHQFSVAHEEGICSVVVKAKGFTERMENVSLGTGLSIVMPIPREEVAFHFMTELWSSSKGTAHPLRHEQGRPVSGGLVIRCGGVDRLIGVVKIKIKWEDVVVGSRLLDRASQPVIDLLGQQRGTAQLSLFITDDARHKPTIGATCSPGVTEAASRKQQGIDQRDETFRGEKTAALPVQQQSSAVAGGSGITDLTASLEENLHLEEAEDAPKSATGRAEQTVRVAVCNAKLNAPFQRCYILCYLESEPSVQYRSAVSESFDLSSVGHLLEFSQDFCVPEQRSSTWFDQAIVIKVVSVLEDGLTERPVGETQLDLSCLLRFGRICGPMGIMNPRLEKTGELTVDIQLLSAISDVCTKQSAHSRGQQEASLLQNAENGKEPHVPLLTCSDDENYVVIGGIDDALLSPRPNEIDSLCDVFMHVPSLKDLHTDQKPSSVSPYDDPFFCDDDFMLNITKIAPPSTSMLVPENAQPRKEPMPVLEIGSDEALLEKGGDIPLASDRLTTARQRHVLASQQTVQNSALTVDSALDSMSQGHPSLLDCTTEGPPPKDISTVDDEKVSVESVDIDELLQKYAIERRPGWWKSLLPDTPPSQETLD